MSHAPCTYTELAQERLPGRSSAPLRGRVLRWVPGRIPLRCMRPGKPWRELRPNPQPRFPGRLQRSEAEWKAIRDPAQELAAKRRRISHPQRPRERDRECRGGLERFRGGPYVSPLVLARLLVPTAHLSDRGLVRVSGAEARTFLDGLVTCELDKVAPDRPRFGALL